MPRDVAIVWMQRCEPLPAEQIRFWNTGKFGPLGAKVIAIAVW